MPTSGALDQRRIALFLSVDLGSYSLSANRANRSKTAAAPAARLMLLWLPAQGPRLDYQPGARVAPVMLRWIQAGASVDAGVDMDKAFGP